MRKNIRNIDELVKKVIEESLQEKADELTNKVKTKMNDDWLPNSSLTLRGVGVTEENDADSDIARLCDEDSNEYDEERCSYNRKAKMVGSEMDEELIGGQKKLDKNKNGRLDKQDFKMLRGDVEEQRDEDDLDWGDKETAMSRMRRGKGDVEDIDFEDIEPESTDFGMEPLDNTRFDDEEYMSDWENRFRDWMKNSKTDEKGYPKYHQKNGKMHHGEEMEEEVEEGNAFTGALAKTKKGDKFQLGGKSYTDRSNLEEAEKFIQRVYEGVKNKKKNVKESLRLTESEMIDLIEKIVMEQKKAKGMAETEKVLSANKKENEDAIKAVTKKMKEYLKDGSKGEYSMEPKMFPKGNGELAKMDKMTYKADKPTDEYIENFTAAGLENLVYDEIHPDEKWVDDNVEGSSRTGNNPEWANAVDNGVNKKRNKIRKDNLLGAVKAIAYNKAPQPVTDDTKSGPAGKFQKNFGKDSGKKATKILNQLESKEDKSEKLISEEFDKIKHLMGYNKNTQ